jgi:hypothetical protein
MAEQESANKKEAKDVPGLKDYWPAFGDASYFEDYENENRGSLAYAVFSEYNIPVKDSNIGGALQFLDIKRKDALSVIKMSLMEYSADNRGIWEFYVDEEGEVQYYEVGKDSGEIEDIYHTTQSITHRESCKGVIVSGEKPMIRRLPTQFRPIWGDGERTIISTQELMIGNCQKESFDEQAIIVFTDPHLQDNQYKDGIRGLFDDFVDNPYQSIVGFVHYMKSDEALTNRDTSIQYNQGSCQVPIMIAGPSASQFNGNAFPNVKLGKLQSRPVIDDKYTIEAGEACWVGLETEASYQNGIPVFTEIDGKENFPSALRFEDVRGNKIDKFTNVTDVFLIGYNVADCYPAAASKEDQTKGADANIRTYVVINDTSMKSVKLERGVHYAVAIKNINTDSNDLIGIEPYVVFANNARQGDPTKFDYSSGEGIEFYFHPRCKYYTEKNLTSETSKSKGVILPLAGNIGFLVYQAWAMINLEAHSIVVNDQRGRDARASEIAKNLVYSVSPLVIEDKPAPLGYASDSVAGKVLDQTDRLKDGDPTTVQNFDETEYELAMDEMRGGGQELSMSCLNEEQVVTLAKEIYEYMNAGEIIETTYICGPYCNPKIGGKGLSNGVINSISYSYTDSSAFTVTINEGGKLAGAMPQVDGGLVLKQAEEVKARGTIIKDLGNHIHYKVSIDGFGERLAVNCCAHVLRVGDKVSVSVHNVPVEA